MSLSSLPTELLQQIIESSVPSTYHTTTYRARRSTLYALCFVSRRFRLIAQPILRQIVSFHWPAGVGSLMKSRVKEVQTWDTVVRQAVVGLYGHNDLFKLVVSSCAQVQKLTITYHSPEDDFGLLSSLTELRDLHIFSHGNSLPRFKPFASLRSFTLGWSEAIQSELQDLLRRSNFPSLQALALSHFERDLLRIFRVSSALHLIENLDSLFISIYDRPHELLDVLKHVLSSTLITSSVDEAVVWASTLAQPIHLCLRDTPDEDYTEKEDEANCKKLAEIIESSTKSPLLSLYLDDSLRPPFGNTSHIESRGLRRLVEACEKRKVEVVYEKGPSNWTKDPIISEEFWRRQRKPREVGEQGSRECKKESLA